MTLHDVLIVFLPGLATLVSGVALLILNSLAKVAKEKFNVDIEESLRAIEQAHQVTLEKSISTWLGDSLAKYGNVSVIDSNSNIGKAIIAGVKEFAPDAVAELDVADKWIIAKANSMLNKQIAATPVTTNIISVPPTPAPAAL